MRFYLTIAFIVAITFELLTYLFSKYREKLNTKFILSKNDFQTVFCHHLLALFNIILLIISLLVLLFYFTLILTIIFSFLTDSSVNLNPILNVPFSVITSIFLFFVFIIFEILCKVNKRVKESIDRLCEINNPYSDEKIGISGNLRYGIIVYILPLTILLFLIDLFLGVEYL